MPRVGACLARSRLITRPFSLPMTGMCHLDTARSMSRSICCARLVMSRPLPLPSPPVGERGFERLPLPSGERAGVRGEGSFSSRGQARLHAVGQGVAPGPLARLDDLPGQRAPDDFLDALRDADQRVEIYARLDAHGEEAVDEVLGADVARGAGSEGAAAEAADR